MGAYVAGDTTNTFKNYYAHLEMKGGFYELYG